MNNWNELAKARMKELGVTQERLAEKLGVTQGAVAHWLSGRREPDLQTIGRVLKALDLPPLSVASALQHQGLAVADSRGNYVGPAERLYRYPVLSAVAAGAFADALQPYEPGAEPDAELTDYKAKGEAFWLEVDGDSMTWTGSPSIPAGHLILVDTGIEPKPGQLVVAKLVSESAATFKKLISDGGRLFLKPLNPDPIYRTVEVDANCRIIGVVKEAKLKL